MEDLDRNLFGVLEELLLFDGKNGCSFTRWDERERVNVLGMLVAMSTTMKVLMAMIYK